MITLRFACCLKFAAIDGAWAVTVITRDHALRLRSATRSVRHV